MTGFNTKSRPKAKLGSSLVFHGSHADLARIAKLLEDGVISGRVSAVMVVGGKKVVVSRAKRRKPVARAPGVRSKSRVAAGANGNSSPTRTDPILPAAPADLVAARRKYAAETRAERERIVSGLTPEQLAEYRENNPVPQEYWEREGQPVEG